MFEDTRPASLDASGPDDGLAEFRVTGPGEIRALLGPLTSSLHALRNWTIAVTGGVKSDVAPSDALAAEIQDFVRTRLSAHEYPREVAFINEMPMTTTGKVIRRLLRERP